MTTALLAPKAEAVVDVRITSTFIEAAPDPMSDGEPRDSREALEAMHAASPAYQYFGRRVRAFGPAA